SSAGDALIYSTYGGGSGIEQATAIAIVGVGGAYITGWTDSTDFPAFATGPGVNAFQTSNRGIENAFVLKLNPTGSGVVYSTCLGGAAADLGLAIAVDGNGQAYV